MVWRRSPFKIRGVGVPLQTTADLSRCPARAAVVGTLLRRTVHRRRHVASPLPTFSISHSSALQWSTCKYQWWLARVASWQGWPGGDRASDPIAASAYRTSKLVTADQLLGIIVHALAAQVVESIRDGKRPPSPDDLHTELRRRMAYVWRRDRNAFIAKPKLRMLLEHYYARAPSADQYRCMPSRTWCWFQAVTPW